MKRNEVKRGVRAVTVGDDGYQVAVWVQYRRFVAGERGGNTRQDVWAVADARGNWYDRTPRQLARLNPERDRLCALLGYDYDCCLSSGELASEAHQRGLASEVA